MRAMQPTSGLLLFFFLKFLKIIEGVQTRSSLNGLHIHFCSPVDDLEICPGLNSSREFTKTAKIRN